MPSNPTRRADPKPEIECAESDCSTRFIPQRSTARFCSATCRRRATDRRNRPASSPSSSESDDGRPEHSLVRAVRRELEQVGALDTVDGQVALQLAKRLATPDESGASSLAKELRASLTAAVVGKSGGDREHDSEVNDEVEQARLRREAKAAKAAGAS